VIRRGDAVTILIQSDGLSVTAAGVARQDGAAGDTIRVHRDGVMTDLSVQVVDAKTVQLEIQP
jgi:flagella basal body P-ring formation protein FlgA